MCARSIFIQTFVSVKSSISPEHIGLAYTSLCHTSATVIYVCHFRKSCFLDCPLELVLMNR